MRLVFAGTPAFASAALAALHTAGHDIALVLTRPDKPAGRGLRIASSEVARLAERLGIATLKPPSLRGGEVADHVRAAQADAMVVAAYGLILPAGILAIPRLGCLNIHASLLPRWRGAAPIEHALLAGDETTGVSMHRAATRPAQTRVMLTSSARITVRDVYSPPKTGSPVR